MMRNITQSFLSLLFIFLTQSANAGVTKHLDELPAMYQQAFRLNAIQEKNILDVNLEALNGYHVYKSSFKVESENYNLKLTKDAEAFKGLDPVTKKIKEFYKEQNTFVYETTLKSNAPSELKNLVISLQACSKDNCLLPVSVFVPIQLQPAMKAETKESSTSSTAPEESTEAGLAAKIKKIFKSSGSVLSLQSLLILFFAGLITAISPCVLPLFPLTLGIFARWSHKNEEKAFGLTLSYGAGIILFFAFNGVISAATGGIFGALTQNPYYLLSVGFIILLAGIIFSGLIPFPFANQLMNLAGTPDASDKAQSYGKLLAKSFAMGASLGLVASPCVGPILLALLAWLSQSLPQGDIRSYLAGFTALSIFGLGLALPFLILGHFYFHMHKRVALGKYSPIAKYAGSLMLVAASFFFLVPGFKILSNKNASAEVAADSYEWDKKPAGKWLVVDFRADWCTACLEIEKEVLKTTEVKNFFNQNNWALVRVDMTNPDAQEKLAQQFEVISLPTLIFFNPEGTECKSIRLNEKESPANFIKRLQSAQNSACR